MKSLIYMICMHDFKLWSQLQLHIKLLYHNYNCNVVAETSIYNMYIVVAQTSVDCNLKLLAYYK
jgi:hypothetical protein